MQQALKASFDAESYLAWEEKQADKHEYLAGEVFAMVGARREHVLVSGNVYAVLKQRLRGRPCQAFISDMKLRLEWNDAFYYPDVMVSCSARDHSAEHFLTEPTLIVEVLSESTAAYDRGDKFAAYRTIVTLKEYVMIDIPARRVECYRRMADNEWLLHDYCGAEVCELASLALSIPMAEIFEDIV